MFEGFLPRSASGFGRNVAFGGRIFGLGGPPSFFRGTGFLRCGWIDRVDMRLWYGRWHGKIGREVLESQPLFALPTLLQDGNHGVPVLDGFESVGCDSFLQLG